MFFYILVALLSQTNQNIELNLEKNLSYSSFSILKYYLNIYIKKLFNQIVYLETFYLTLP